MGKALRGNALSRAVAEALEEYTDSPQPGRCSPGIEGGGWAEPDTVTHSLRSACSICVVVPDATRPLSFEPVLRPLLEYLTAFCSDVEIVVGLGLHRPMNPEESAPIRRLADDFDISWSQHDADGDLVEKKAATDLPSPAPTPLPIELNRRVADAGCVICVGTVEPHQYAGYSGGVKAVSIGCAGAATISAMHGLSLLRDRRTTLGVVDENPFRTCLDRIAKPVGELLGLQLVPAFGGGVSQINFGPLPGAFKKACKRASTQFFKIIQKRPVDWLYLPVRAPKATNFYQASRAATYVSLVDRPAIADGGVIIVEARCPEGIGTGDGEKACAQAMARGQDALWRELQGDEKIDTCGGQQRAYVLARALDRHRICLVGAPPIESLKPMGIEQFDTADAAFEYFDLQDGAGRRIDDVFHRIPQSGCDG